MRYIERLQFITSEITDVKRSVEAGMRWVQLRIKDRTRNEIKPIAQEALAICKANGAVLIINDDPYLCAEINAHGVHLGQTDTPVMQARTVLGPTAIIGHTVNTQLQIEQDTLLHPEINYLGLGPFRYTTTKENLSPVLGLEGYRQIMHQYTNATPIEKQIPIVAVGGITAEDVHALRSVGVHGVAISSALARASDIHQAIHQFQKNLSI